MFKTKQDAIAWAKRHGWDRNGNWWHRPSFVWPFTGQFVPDANFIIRHHPQGFYFFD